MTTGGLASAGPIGGAMNAGRSRPAACATLRASGRARRARVPSRRRTTVGMDDPAHQRSAP